MAAEPTEQVISGDSFFKVALAAWSHLSPATWQAIRRINKTGRTIHDERVTDLPLWLGRAKPGSTEAEAGVPREQVATRALRATYPPDLTELRSTLGALARRKAPVQCLRLHFHKREAGHLPVKDRAEQLLVVLDVLSSKTVSSLALHGGVPLSREAANAISRKLPGLKNLSLNFEWEENDLPHGDRTSRDSSMYYGGLMSLMSLCAPRLESLEVTGGSVHEWTLQTLMAVGWCTHLTSLTLEAGRRDGGKGPYLGSFEQQDDIMSTVAQLTKLRSLRLRTALDPDTCTRVALAPHATTFGCLSALTALTSLQLDLPAFYEPHDDSWAGHEQGGAKWAQVREVHRASVLSALCCMPQLQHLDCPTLWLHASEAATLTSLTKLRVGGLHSPPLTEGIEVAGPLPPQLVKLTLESAASFRLLASLQVPSSLATLHVRKVCFGMSDVSYAEDTPNNTIDSTLDGAVRKEAVKAVGPAVRLMARLRGGKPAWGSLVVLADTPLLLLPRPGVLEGHTEWLSKLSGLVGVDKVELHSLQLDHEDIACLARALGRVSRLSIQKSAFPVSSISTLLTMAALEELELDLSRCPEFSRAAVEKALLVLCREAPVLRHVLVSGCPPGSKPRHTAILSGLHRKAKFNVQLSIQAI